ncbi:MAG TPA: hypothetical protein VG248_13425 [Caulobacteraceae bacterium]|jgi:acetyl esterase/lipase|nr:hypothetical protein [Caulobacteraceae bacterium]
MRLHHLGAQAQARRASFELGQRPDGRALLVDLWRPQAGEGPWPVALLLHGAAPDSFGLPFRESALFEGWGRALASAGAAALAFDHTLGWPAFRLDHAMAEIEAVLCWLDADGPRLSLDPTRLTAIASSAAGVLAAELATRAVQPRIGRLALLSPLAAAPDEAEATAPVRARMDLAGRAAEVAAAGVRLVIVRAGADEAPRLQALDCAVAALSAAGAGLSVIDAPGAPHAFEAVRAGPDTDAAVEATLALAGWR